MRLLQLQDNGEFALDEYLGENVPPYAILSHTWGAQDEEEVRFRDLTKGTGKNKAGYLKLTFCAKQAAHDGLQFFWVDTCCIDKSSHVELSEAINSMFRWYRKAAKCYVYLSDVSIDGSSGKELSSQRSWIPAFRRSRWFTRGWTLQELIAPSSVEFFSVEGERLGDKNSLLQEIHDITGIPIEALQGSDLSMFSIDERLSWSERRTTRVEEDAVYSLLGIFNIVMPPIYGEGRQNALVRLVRSINKIDLTYDLEKWVDLPTDIPHASTTDEFKTELDEMLDTDSDAGTDVANIFSDGGISTSSASTASLNPVQTIGIREVSRALLSQEDLKALYTMAVLNVERRKVRVHIRGFLKEYGRNLLKEASNRGLEIQAAKFVQELAGRIADEISWSITGSEEMGRPLETKLAKKDLETWLSSLQPQSVDVEKEPNSIDPGASVDEMFEDGESDEEVGDDILFPNIDKVKDFLLNSEAFGIYVTAMRTWLKVDGGHKGDIEKPAGNMPVHTDTEEVVEESPADSSASGLGQHQTEHIEKPPAEFKPDSQQDTAQEPESRSTSRQNRGGVNDLISGLSSFWGISFFFYDLVELFVPRVRPGYKRLRWRCVSLGVPRYSFK
ncbi:hypothetical protein DL767_004458 [Monosporascus sp. MG133]|nr:hypothetical protein DL767_004458 [Monosporascus sp. MG133]